MFGLKSKTAQELFAQTQKEWIDGARATARRLLRTRECIDIEDVLEVYPFPNYLNHNVRGTVFKHPDFRHYGFTNAKRPIAKGTVLHTWCLNK